VGGGRREGVIRRGVKPHDRAYFERRSYLKGNNLRIACREEEQPNYTANSTTRVASSPSAGANGKTRDMWELGCEGRIIGRGDAGEGKPICRGRRGLKPVLPKDASPGGESSGKREKKISVAGAEKKAPRGLQAST